MGAWLVRYICMYGGPDRYGRGVTCLVTCLHPLNSSLALLVAVLPNCQILFTAKFN